MLSIKAEKKMEKRLKYLYILALSLIALLTVSSQIIIQYSIQNEEYDSRIVNIAGRQRMLSQRITKCTLYIYNAGNNDEIKKYRDELIFSANLWKESHLGLQNGNEKMGLPGNNSKKIKELFSIISANHENILNSAFKIIAATENYNFSHDELLKEINNIRENEPLFLKGMDNIVFQYDSEAKEKISNMKNLELILMFFTLFVLSLEARFIFMPASKQIHKDFIDIEEKHQNLEKLFSVGPSALFLIDAETFKIIKMNDKARALLGVSDTEQFKESIDHYLDSENESNQKFLVKVKNNEIIDGFEVIFLNSSKNVVIALASATKLFFENKPIIAIAVSDISEQKKIEQALHYHATFDEMTGLVNRRTGLWLLTKELETVKRENRDMSICYIDVNNLKNVNDTYGHTDGDWLIKNVAKTILDTIRTGDTGIRLGGDEFLIILNNCNSKNGSEVLLRIEEKLEDINKVSGKPYKLSISYGFADFITVKPKTLEEFINTADNAMYEDKKRKKGLE